MTTLAKHMIVAGVENRPPLLDKIMYNSGKCSFVCLYIIGNNNVDDVVDYHMKMDLNKLPLSVDKFSVHKSKESGKVKGIGMQATQQKGHWEFYLVLGKDVICSNFVLSEVPQHDTYPNDNMVNQSVQES
ncbi:hypothetical protein Tco_0570002 [Tanacetum coccineum]